MLLLIVGQKKFPGYQAVKPYLRFYPLPEDKTSVVEIKDISEEAAAEFLAV
jgi:hypothetical protein